jgi:DNA-binding GntR family transcriptional regulator
MLDNGTEGQPLYVQVAHVLSNGIAENQFPIGSLLPTEEALSEKFGVSRHTVREAIRHLRAQGLLSARRGIGTRVEARRADTRYTHSLRSLADLSQYAQETTFKVFDTREVIADTKLAELLGSRAGKSWMHITGLRSSDDGAPIATSSIYIDKAFAGVLKDVGVQRGAVYSLIEQRYGETVEEMQQDIAASTVPAEHADILQAKAGSPALRITRRYFGAGGRLLEVAFSLHPADRFIYSMRLKRDAA